ncbi:MAG: transcriptional repressor [Proteobacteria bacterium]|nr:transcriptional repressor [Pseudomonadota bacterium]
MSDLPTLKGPTKLVYEVLSKKKVPLGAYDILAALSKHGVTGPPTIYRALEKLASQGLIHRISSINAYIICDCHHGSHISSFMVCKKCKSVEEISDRKVENALRTAIKNHSFKIEKEMIELIGLCETCATTA